MNSDHENQSIRASIGHMTEMMREMKSEISGMREDLAKIAVHDEKIDGLGDSQDEIRKRLDKHEEAHRFIDKFIWSASAVGATLIVIWTLGGWHIIDSLKYQSELNADIRLHIHDAEKSAAQK